MDSSGLYLDVTDFAHSTPTWVQSAFEFWTEYGLLVFGALFIAVWWRSRGARDPRTVALAVLAPFVTALAYVASELVKSSVDEERPCRAVAGAAVSLVKCPATGDWSFPSNHATIAGAGAVALALAVRKLVLLTVPLALLMAFSGSSSACTTRTTWPWACCWARASPPSPASRSPGPRPGSSPPCGRAAAARPS